MLTDASDRHDPTMLQRLCPRLVGSEQPQPPQRQCKQHEVVRCVVPVALHEHGKRRQPLLRRWSRKWQKHERTSLSKCAAVP